MAGLDSSRHHNKARDCLQITLEGRYRVILGLYLVRQRHLVSTFVYIIVISSDMNWASNTYNMVKKANKKLWILGRLKFLGATELDLVDIYIKQVRCLLELAVPAWHGAITLVEQNDIERVQRSVAYIILGDNYLSYKDALKYLGLDSLNNRRDKLCLKFGRKAEKHEKFRKWFKPATYKQFTRQAKLKYCGVVSKHTRFEKSPLSFLTRMLNQFYRIK